jgi:mycothiol S-conjugate amidase
MLAVHAHPDDESSKGAATMARYVDAGAAVLVVTCTGGERGSVLNPELKDRADIEENIEQVRRDEMAKAAAVLGVRHEWLGFVDSGFPEGDPPPPLPEGCFGLIDPAEGIDRLVGIIRRFRPHVMTTYDENGGYPHPDHVQTHVVSVGAFEKAADPAYRPDLGDAWRVLKLYYDVGFSMERFAAIDAILTARGLESPFAEWREHQAERAKKREEDGRRAPNITTRVHVADWFERRDQALLAHATQVDPNGWFFAVPLDVQREAWPTEDFELVTSFVASALPEDDLFAGVREKVAT